MFYGYVEPGVSGGLPGYFMAILRLVLLGVSLVAVGADFMVSLVLLGSFLVALWRRTWCPEAL